MLEVVLVVLSALVLVLVAQVPMFVAINNDSIHPIFPRLW